MARARTLLERGTAVWATGDVWQTQTLVHEAYPAIAEGNRAHDISRSWLYLGLISMSLDKLDGADVDESPQTRQRVRDFARTRLSTLAGDALLAEILAAESDY